MQFLLQKLQNGYILIQINEAIVWFSLYLELYRQKEGIEITIYDIAALAGVSPSTVSRALNGKPGVSRKKRELIQKVLEENHYIPDENARSLVMGRTRLVGIVTDDLDSQHQNEAIAHCQNELIVNGYQCITRYTGKEPDSMGKAIAELRLRKVEGVLLIGLSFVDHERLEKLIQRWLPDVPVLLVYQNERINMDNVYCIGANEERGFRCCVEQLIEHNRRNLVLIVEKNRASQPKIQTYFEAAAQEHPDVRYGVYTGVEPCGGAEEVVNQILKEHPDADGVLCVQDRLAIEVMYAFMERGKRIPEDISVIGEGNSELCEVCRPKLTSLDTMVPVATMMSVRILVDVMEGRAQTHKITLDMELVKRQSL